MVSLEKLRLPLLEEKLKSFLQELQSKRNEKQIKKYSVFFIYNKQIIRQK